MPKGNKNMRNVPNLRFPEFQGEWGKTMFDKICTITTGNKNTQDKIEDGIYPFYVRSSIIERINSYTFDGEAVLTAGDGVGVGKVFHYVKGKIGVHQRVYILSNFKCDGKFSYYYFSSRFYNRVRKMSAKNSVDSVRHDMIAKMSIMHPERKEQQKIAAFLSLIDERIQTQNKIIEDLKLQKEALVEHLFRQEYPTRFSGFSDKWNLFTYNELFDVSTTKNTDNSIDNVLSASQIYGMIDRNEIDIDIKFDEKSIKSYKIVEPGDYVIHLRSFQGGFAFSDKKGICSPAYTILKPKELLEYGFLKEYFMSGRFIKSLKLVTYGIRDGRSISVSEFMKLKIYLPSKSEQIKIMEALSAINEKINLNGKLGDLLQKQKRYLLKNMFV